MMNALYRVNYHSFTRILSLALVLCVTLLAFTGCAKKKSIVNGVSEREANEILVYLKDKGIEADKVKAEVTAGAGAADRPQLWNISVPIDQEKESMRLLNQAGYPKYQGQTLLEIFKDSGLVPSELQERVKWEAGRAEQIGNIIRSNVPGVLNAEVILSFPEKDPLNPEADKKKKITATVVIVHSGIIDDPSAQIESKIKRLVASGVPELSYDDVTVTSFPSRFTDDPLTRAGRGRQEQEFVKVWTMIIGLESVPRFRSVFFAFILLIMILLLALIWVSWKIYPVLQQHGGVRKLFSVEPLVGEPVTPVKEEEVEEEEEEEEKEEGEELPGEPESVEDSDVDQT